MSLTQHWPFNDNAASTTIVATTGTNISLSGGNNTSDLYSPTGPGNLITASLNLNGTTDYINAPGGLISRPLNNAFSISFWVNLDSVTTQHLAGTTSNSNHRYTLASPTSFEVRTASTFTYAIPTVTTGTWINPLITYDTSNNCRVFLNGVESSSGAQTVGGVSSLVFGRSLATEMDGRMAWVKVWDSDESANAAAIYAEGGVGIAQIFINPITSRILGGRFDPLRTI